MAKVDTLGIVAASAAHPRSALKKRVLLVVRKMHLYLGLLLFPWVMFFGASGMLFNHPGLGESVRARPLAPALLHEHTGLTPLHAQRTAEQVVQALRAEGVDAKVDTSYPAHLQGSLAYALDARGEKHLLLVNLPAARGVVLSRPDHGMPAAPFARTLQLPGPRVSELGPKLATLFPALGIESQNQQPALRSAPSLRFRLRDGHGTAWNVTYDLASGALYGRPSEQAPELSLHDLLGEMHKTHHYPAELGVGTWWALLADLTGLTMILWALTGLAMWWQLKRTRLLGAAAVSLGLFVAAWVMLGTHRDLRFGNVQPQQAGRAQQEKGD